MPAMPPDELTQPTGTAGMFEGDNRERYALLSYRTNNLGDEIQSIAAAQFLPGIDLHIDRDRLDQRPEGAPHDYKIILNGWYTHAPEAWPPGAFLTPLITSFHITREIFSENAGGLCPAEILIRGDSLRYLRDHGPIGARDLSTAELLHHHGVDSYFSGCLTLTLGASRLRSRGDYVCAVDLPERLLSRMRESTRSQIVVRTHHCIESSIVERTYMGRRLLSLYAQAKCVVTTRLHCALPCLALGTPVLFVRAAQDSYRFAGLVGFLQHCSPQEYLEGLVSFDSDKPPPNPDAFLPYRAALIRKISRFCHGPTADAETPLFPFQPEPISDMLLTAEPTVATHSAMAASTDFAFRRIFRPGRDYKDDQRPDFLRDLGRVHGDSGERTEALRLLQTALDERPNGIFIKRSLERYTKATQLLQVSPLIGDDPASKPIAAGVQHAKLTYLEADRLGSLLQELKRAKARKVTGDFVEFGVALGGSGICIASELEGARRYWGFDSFSMMPPPTGADGIAARERYEVIASGQSKGIGGDRYYGYIDELYRTVVANFAQFGLRVDGRTVNLVAGMFQQTLPQQAFFPIAFAHVDCDWYEEVKYCLNFLHERLSRFGVVIADDYNDWPGCRKAVDEFCSSQEDIMLARTTPHAVLLKL